MKIDFDKEKWMKMIAEEPDGCEIGAGDPAILHAYFEEIKMNKEKEEAEKTKEPCKHKHIEFDESTGTTVCQDCWTTLRPKYDNSNNHF